MIDGTEVIGRLVPALALLALVPVLLRRWLRKGRMTGGGNLRVVGRTPMGRSSSAVIVESGERRFLLGVTEHSIGLIAELEGVQEDDTPSARGMDAPAPTLGPWTGLERWREMTLRRLPEDPARVIEN